MIAASCQPPCILIYNAGAPAAFSLIIANIKIMITSERQIL